MLQFPHTPEASQFTELFQQIEVLSQTLMRIPHSDSVQKRVLHQELLKSSLFSARIEGNTLTLASAAQRDLVTPKDRQSQEISNVLQTLRTISDTPYPLNAEYLLKLHSKVMQELDSDAGKFRNESSAIYDQYGSIVYLPPSPAEMHAMIEGWLGRISSQKSLTWQSQLLLAAASHYYFEKIHPFIDGNGRTGRVVLQAQLNWTGLFAEYCLPIDQFFDEHISEYYLHLEKNSRNVESFVEYFLRAVVWATERLLQDITQAMQESDTRVNALNLLPRRQELLAIITDHPFISLDSLARRFHAIPRRTITYDVHQLVKMGLVVMHGKTRGARYSVTPMS